MIILWVTVAAIVYVLWTRRFTLFIPWERATTTNVIGLTLCMVLIAPRVTDLVSAPMHAITGLWNVEDLIGHLCYLVGLGALLHTMISRLNLPDRRRYIRMRIELPAIIGLPTMIGVFVAYNGDRPLRDFIAESVERGGWILVYWLVFSAGSMWIIGHLVWVLWIIRGDRRSAAVANLYLVALALDTICAIGLALNAIFSAIPAWPAYLFMCAACLMYCAAAWWSWQCKLRYFHARSSGLGLGHRRRPRVRLMPGPV